MLRLRVNTVKLHAEFVRVFRPDPEPARFLWCQRREYLAKVGWKRGRIDTFTSL